MYKTVLTETALYDGFVKMPKGFELDNSKFEKAILHKYLYKDEMQPHHVEMDKLNNYIMENMKLKHDLSIYNIENWGNIYEPNQSSIPCNEVNSCNLRDSAYFILLYGVKIAKDSCKVQIYFKDNKRGDKFQEVPLHTNSFIMFPATNTYWVKPNTSADRNYIQSITYELT